jgi:putative ABC transport system permease protein
MFKIAILSLLHERGKVVAALSGVAFSASLVLAQTGLYVGFQHTTTNVISRIGGEVWVMARGTRLLDQADTVSASSRRFAAGHPCVSDTRGVVFSWVPLRTRSGAADMVQLIGYEPDASGLLLPWNVAHGLPRDLHGPMRVAVDRADTARLQLPENPLGAELQLMGQPVYVGAVTRGIRSFTVAPYFFAEATQAQRVLGLSEDQFTFWSVSLRSPSCIPDVVAYIERHPDLSARPLEEFRSMTSSFWINNSGVGALLGFSALLGLIVGLVIVAQTLFAMTENHLRELATLKAIGASGRELMRFSSWQAGFFALTGSALGVLFAYLVKLGVALAGLELILSNGVLLCGIGSTFGMCWVASLASTRRVIALEAAEVFR